MTIVVKKLEGVGSDMLPDLLKVSIYGDCYHFALAMHRELNWDIIGLFVEDGKLPVHVGVKSSEGKIWDGRGEISEKEFIEPFVKNSAYKMREVTEEELLVSGTVNESRVEYLQKKAQIVWPNLAWKEKTFQQRVTEFAKELEGLSRKYGLWICKTYPPDSPTIVEGYGDEVGYEISPNVHGGSFSINRILE